MIRKEEFHLPFSERFIDRQIYRKIEYMNYNFNGDVLRDETPVRIEAQDTPQRDSF